MPATKPIDPSLLDYCRNDNQRAVIQALIKHGGHQRDAAEELGKKSKSSISEVLSTIKRQAARKGYAPGHWKDGVAAGYQMGKVTAQRGPKGVERVWVLRERVTHLFRAIPFTRKYTIADFTVAFL